MIRSPAALLAQYTPLKGSAISDAIELIDIILPVLFFRIDGSAV